MKDLADKCNALENEYDTLMHVKTKGDLQGYVGLPAFIQVIGRYLLDMYRNVKISPNIYKFQEVALSLPVGVLGLRLEAEIDKKIESATYTCLAKLRKCPFLLQAGIRCIMVTKAYKSLCSATCSPFNNSSWVRCSKGLALEVKIRSNPQQVQCVEIMMFQSICLMVKS